MRVTRLAVLGFGLLLSLGSGLRAEEPAVPADRFLRDWIEGTARFSMFAEFHARFSGSFHKRGAEELEVAWRCLRARNEIGGERTAALVDEIAGRLDDPGESERRRRIAFVLGRLQATRALPLLIRATAEGEEDARDEALEALALFGNRRYGDVKGVFGGRIWKVVFPPRPDRRATEALLEALDEPEPRWERGEKPVDIAEHLRRREAFRERRGAWASRRRTTLRALESHDVPAVTDLAVRGDHLGLLAAIDSPRTVTRLGELTRTGERRTRLQAIEALALTSRREALPPLLDALLDRDPDDSIRRAAQEALTRLVDGERVRPEAIPDGAQVRKRWIEQLGPELEHFDADAAGERREARRPAPGLYRIGW